ncbi:unnamed protein product [Timema podura]|uniref:Uncharacterized protein n=1 Tax=Timema podura TaxID=61482 RepID=A0ABN7NY30_TIMPD|nr:unnamed protein product [Timema podura]
MIQSNVLESANGEMHSPLYMGIGKDETVSVCNVAPYHEEDNILEQSLRGPVKSPKRIQSSNWLPKLSFSNKYKYYSGADIQPNSFYQYKDPQKLHSRPLFAANTAIKIMEQKNNGTKKKIIDSSTHFKTGKEENVASSSKIKQEQKDVPEKKNVAIYNKDKNIPKDKSMSKIRIEQRYSRAIQSPSNYNVKQTTLTTKVSKGTHSNNEIAPKNNPEKKMSTIPSGCNEKKLNLRKKEENATAESKPTQMSILSMHKQNTQREIRQILSQNTEMKVSRPSRVLNTPGVPKICEQDVETNCGEEVLQGEHKNISKGKPPQYTKWDLNPNIYITGKPYKTRVKYLYMCQLVRMKEGFGGQINLFQDRGLNPRPSAQKSDTLPLDH